MNGESARGEAHETRKRGKRRKEKRCSGALTDRGRQTLARILVRGSAQEDPDRTYKRPLQDDLLEGTGGARLTSTIH